VSTPTRAPRALALIEKVLLGFIAGAAAAIGVTDLVFLVQRVIRLATESPLVVSGMPLTDGSTEAIAPGVTTTIDSVTLTLDSAPDSARAFLVVAAILGSLLTLVICGGVAWLSLRVFLGRPFVTSATWAIGAVAIAIMVCGIGSQFFTGLAQAEIGLALDTDALPSLALSIDLAPFGWGAALAVVAACFELGQRLQRDTEGLV
jgi:hypothetical protein